MRIGVLVAAAMLCALYGPAVAQVESREAIALQNEIAELRQELQAIQQSQGGVSQPSPSSPYTQPPYGQPQYPPPQGSSGDTAAELVVRVSALEEQTRALQGRVDDLTNQMQHQHDDLAKQIGDLAFKLGQGASPVTDGQTAGAATPGISPLQAPGLRSPMPPAVATHRTPELALREGNAALARRDYAAAAAAAREAMAGGHGSAATSAQFLLARAEGGLHMYKEAAADFYQAYNRSPRSATAPVALLGVANALIAMNDGRDACQALAKLQVEYPGAASVKAGLASARRRAACAR